MSLTANTSAATFEALWSSLTAEPYDVLPVYRVESSAFGRAGEHGGNHLRGAARRALDDAADLVDFGGAKLFQANGICFAGAWSMDERSAYTGAFRAGLEARAIVRLSVMSGDVLAEDRRALGAGIKLFFESQDGQPARTNVLLMDSFAGSRRRHVLDASLDNHPALGGLPNWGLVPVLLRIRADLRAALAAGRSGAKADYRYFPLQAAAGAGLRGDEATPAAPKWLRLTAAPGLPRVDAADFRDELRLEHYPDGVLTFELSAADHHGDGKDAAEWRRIGLLRLTSDVVSAACDKRLHFPHGAYRAVPD